METEEGNSGRRLSRVVRAGRSLVHMTCLRYPRTMARVLGELPLKSLRPIYSVASDLEQNIPNNVYQTWQIDRVGQTHLSELARFRAQNREYSFHFFDQRQMNEYMETYFKRDEILNVYRRAKYGPLKADIWRYCILWERGGVYFDINKMPGIPLAQLIDKADLAIISFERNPSPSRCSPSVASQLLFPHNNVLNWGLMFAKGHPFLRLVIDGIVEKASTFAGREVSSVKSSILALSGPHHLTECLYKYIEKSGADHIKQAGIDFFSEGSVEIRRAFVRYVTMPSYALSASGVILE
jgi:mannosyltransferase OCH1-like enzyme